MPFDSGAMEAELLRTVIETIAHDLGSLSSALALRADVMGAGASNASVEAFQAIAGELRSLGQQLRAFRVPLGGETLAAAGAGSLVQWLSLLTRFAQPLLGRGVALHGTVENVHIGADTVHELTYIALAMLHAIRERPATGHSLIRITSAPRAHGHTILISLDGSTSGSSVAEISNSRWWQWALERAACARIGVRIEGSQVALHLSLGTGA